MINNLIINNFKSIKSLEFDCKKWNIFIGEPNTGKSNILEVFGVLSSLNYYKMNQFVRMENPQNLFHDENIDDKVSIKINKKFEFELKFLNQKFQGKFLNNGKVNRNYTISNLGFIEKDIGGMFKYLEEIKYYKFKVLNEYSDEKFSYLTPPNGLNLVRILKINKEIKTEISQLLKKFGLKLMLRQQKNKIEVVKAVDDILISYPFFLISDTIQRLIFYLTILISNTNSVLAFEEPESKAFPYYTKFLAEKIALDEKNNQFFISTHNPYFLLSILEKVPSNNINIFITYFKDYQTNIKSLSQNEMKKILDLDMDIFFNIESFLEKKE